MIGYEKSGGAMRRKSYVSLYLIFFCLYAKGGLTAADLPNAGQTTAQIVATAKPDVVTVLVYEGDGDKPDVIGSGWFYDRDQIVTNFHVVAKARRAVAVRSDGKLIHIKGPIADDPRRDLVILQTETSDDPGWLMRTPLRISQAQPAVGDKLVILGSPLGLELSASDGIASAIRSVPPYGDVIQTTAAISHGSSGSPILNDKAEVVGVAAFQQLNGQQLNFGISAQSIQKLDQHLPTSFDNLKKRDFEAAFTPRLQVALIVLNQNDRDPKNIADARKAIDAEIKDDPTNWLAWAYKATFCCDDDVELQVQCFEKAAELHPDDGNLLNGLGLAYRRSNQTAAAVKAYQLAVEAEPHNTKYQISLASVLSDTGALAEAATLLEKVTKDSPESSEAWYELGSVSRKLGNLDRSITNLEHAIRLTPNNAAYYRELAYTCIESKDFPTAVKNAQHAVNLEPKNSIHYDLLGCANVFMGHSNDAMNCYREAVRLNPRDVNAIEGIIAIYAGAGNVKQAQEELNKLKEVDSNAARRTAQFLHLH
ncbi:MAG: tetratricopeptide repeat protein [Tepidisphaeraceae bacterium]